MELLEKEDIQGLVARGYGKLKAARYILLEITDAAKAKTYLNAIADDVNKVSVSPDTFALQVAFTCGGLKKIGLPADAYQSFSREFLEGMHESFRSLILGDQHQNHPSNWVWGGPNNKEVHIMLLVYAIDNASLQSWLNNERNSFVSNGLAVILVQETNSDLIKEKEHFGFRDGISNPSMNGFSATPEKGNLNPGEFVLGYTNQYNIVSERPSVKAVADPQNLLPVYAGSDGVALKDLGKNGSYLIYRQMNQHVYKFWKYLHDNSKELGNSKVDSAVRLGAKMVGRWPGGAPLATSPNCDDPLKAEENDFMYSKVDPDGMGCPMGSHVRRTNPRDQLTGRTTEPSAEMINKHRLIRRGRSYGPGCVEDLEPAAILLKGEDGEARGLHFICLVSDISRQFEFIQNAWVKSPAFNGLMNDGDPIIAARNGSGTHPDSDFTCPAAPFRRKYKDVPQFTTLIGGGYFFLPGIKALKYIANC